MKVLFVFFVLEHRRREVLHFNITEHPTAAWTAQQMVEAFADRDGARAIGQTFWTHADSGRMQFNYSEFVGNSTAVAISNTYYQGNRDAASALVKLGAQVGVDMAANILKEFSSDLNRKFFRKRHNNKGTLP